VIGGAASFTIGGDAEGDITVHEVSSLTIGGNASGNIFVTGMVTGPLTVSGEITSLMLTIDGSVAPTGQRVGRAPPGIGKLNDVLSGKARPT